MVVPKNLLRILSVLFVVAFFHSCTKDINQVDSPKTESYSANYLIDYYDLICQTTKNTPGFFPPQAARAYGYISIANYEAVLNGIDGATSLKSQLKGFSNYTLPLPEDAEYSWAIASNAAVAQMMRYMFDKNLKPSDRILIEDMEKANLKEMSSNISTEIVDRSVSFGKKVADVIYDYSKADGGHEAYLEPFQKPYAIPTDPYCWVPTGPVKDPLSPRWGNNRPFMDDNISKTKVPMPVTFSEIKDSEFYKEAMATYNQVKNNTTEQIEIAKYWSDDPFITCTPAGHTFNIMTQILFEENATLAKASVALARLGIAENDAFIACWKGKYEAILLRPVTYINRYIDPSWKTILGTPPFPAYTSGHSCEMGAGSRVLSAIFTKGDGDYQFTDYSQLRYGFFARSFSNFDVMAEECANSRLYGGIHYPMDNSKGLQLGRAIGDNVNKRLKWPADVK
jgi:hypothetical protein